MPTNWLVKVAFGGVTDTKGVGVAVPLTGNLWMPVGVHMAFDWGETYFYGVADSGQVLPGHLLNSTFSGRAWLSGGSVGPEGSLLCTLLILVVWLLCALWLGDVKYPQTVSSRIPTADNYAYVKSPRVL